MIRAPVTGTILERIVEKGEFVTTGFSGANGPKGFVVSLADLSEIEVELDINQSDFAKLHFGHKATVFTDAYPDRKYKGSITEISPEANRQKATVQVKVKILNPDDYLRPEMNATVPRCHGATVQLKTMRSARAPRRVNRRVCPSWWCPQRPSAMGSSGLSKAAKPNSGWCAPRVRTRPACV